MNTTVIIPTTGSPQFADALGSLLNQTRPCRILLVVDGPEYNKAVAELLSYRNWNVPNTIDQVIPHNMKLLTLPENVGANGWYGHRVYASVPMLVNTKYVAFLDQDNWFGRDWVEIMEECIEKLNADIVTCRRTVVRQDGSVIGRDTRESVGMNAFGYTLHDTNTYLFRQSIAHKICPAIYGQWGADRPFTEAVLKQNHRHLSGYYGTFYRSPERLYQYFQDVCK